MTTCRSGKHACNLVLFQMGGTCSDLSGGNSIQISYLFNWEHIFYGFHRHPIQPMNYLGNFPTVNTTRIQNTMFVVKREIVGRTEHAFVRRLCKCDLLVFRHNSLLHLLRKFFSRNYTGKT